MTYDQFCSALRENPEYLLLFQECQAAALSSPSVAHSNSDNTTTAELVAVTMES
jgi:hypothetical protein